MALSGIQTERGTNKQFITAAVCVAVMLVLDGDKIPTLSLGRLHENCVFPRWHYKSVTFKEHTNKPHPLNMQHK